MSVVPQQSFRPNHLPLNFPSTNPPNLFTPNDLAISTPELLHVLTSQTPGDTQPSYGAQTYTELVPPRSTIPAQQNYQTLIRNRSISSSLCENESSSSTAPSSPTSVHRGEFQNVPSVGSMVGDDSKDVLRREKKRERNRQAAQKCRTRKLTRIAELQQRVNELQDKNKDLTGIAEALQSDICRLEKQLQDHHTQGCALLNGSMI